MTRLCGKTRSGGGSRRKKQKRKNERTLIRRVQLYGSPELSEGYWLFVPQRGLADYGVLIRYLERVSGQRRTGDVGLRSRGLFCASAREI